MEKLRLIVSEINDNNGKSINTAIYVDYENVLKRLKEYNIHPVNDIDFFRLIGNVLKDNNFNIVKYIAFANFDDFDFKKNDQTHIQSFGVETKHTSSDGKTSSDMDLIVDALQDLYKNPNIQLFVIISSDRDYIPLLKAIKLENKFTFVISTKNGFNEVVSIFSNYHEFIENIFDFDTKGYILNPVTEDTIKIGVNINDITDELKERAKEVTDLLYTSPLWQEYINNNSKVVGLTGYADVIVKKIKKDAVRKDIIRYFHVAHTLGLVCLYEDDIDKNLYFKKVDVTDKGNVNEITK